MPQLRALAKRVGVARACTALGEPRRSSYRAHTPKTANAAPTERSPHPRALTADKQEAVRQELKSERFADATPRTAYHRLLAEGRVLCHWRTMYRLLPTDAASRERRALRQRSVYTKPELLAHAPHQVWSWDITLLRGPTPGVWYNLYVLLDIFSRKIVGWLLDRREEAVLAEALIAESCRREGIQANQLTLHADRGAPMTSKTLAELLIDLGVAQSHSRPSIVDDFAFETVTP